MAKKRTARENLKSYSWIYIISAVLLAVAMLICNFVPDIVNEFKSMFNDENVMLMLNISAVVSVLFYLWYFWLARRVADGKSSGMFFMILLIIGVVGSVMSAITSKSAVVLTTWDFLIDALGIFFLARAMGEKKK